jgi:uncharacterized protein DUF2514
MSFILGLLGGPLRLWLIGGAIAAVLAFVGYQVHHQREIGRDEIRTEWSASISEQRAAALAQSEANARETQRRLDRQKENQDAQDKQLALARDDARRNAADAERLRAQAADAARRWSDALSNSPTGEQCAAAGAAILVQADVLGRIDRRAGELASYADAARAAGLKCVADYSALTPP